MNQRLRASIIKYVIVIGICAIYALFVISTGIGIPCPIYTLTGLKCPGCGISRMFISLICGDISSAFHHNTFVFVTSPAIITCIVLSEIDYIKNTDKLSIPINVIMWAEIFLALAFGVIRNII